MRTVALQEAIELAERFLVKAQEALAERKQTGSFGHRKPAAAKRASLDLSMALVRLRNRAEWND